MKTVLAITGQAGRVRTRRITGKYQGVSNVDYQLPSKVISLNLQEIESKSVTGMIFSNKTHRDSSKFWAVIIGFSLRTVLIMLKDVKSYK